MLFSIDGIGLPAIPHSQLTRYAEDAIGILENSISRENLTVGTESRLRLVIDTLTDLVQGASSDRDLRLRSLLAHEDGHKIDAEAIHRDGRCEVTQTALLEVWQSLVPEDNDDVRANRNLGGQLRKLEELMFVRQFDKEAPSWEVRRILKARLPHQELERLRGHLDTELKRRGDVTSENKGDAESGRRKDAEKCRVQVPTMRSASSFSSVTHHLSRLCVNHLANQSLTIPAKHDRPLELFTDDDVSEKLKSGFRLGTFEVFNWGTFDGQVHSISPHGTTVDAANTCPGRPREQCDSTF